MHQGQAGAHLVLGELSVGNGSSDELGNLQAGDLPPKELVTVPQNHVVGGTVIVSRPLHAARPAAPPVLVGEEAASASHAVRRIRWLGSASIPDKLLENITK